MSPLSTQQARLQEDLRGLLTGEVRCDDVTRQLYATDAGPLEILPAAVVWPRSTADVVATVQYAAEHGLAVHPRGSGTTTAGGSLGPGILLDFTRSMRRILHGNDETVVVQPGAIRERFNDILRRTSDRFFAPSCGFLPTSTLGSIVSTDLAGPRFLRDGFPHEYVRGMEVVLASGEVVELTDLELRPGWIDAVSPTVGGLGTILGASDVKVRTQSGHIPAGSGYGLTAFSYSPPLVETDAPVRPPHFSDRKTIFSPHRIFAGAEGSLGIITELTLATATRPQYTAGAVLLFDSLDAAGQSVAEIRKFHPTLCELIDRRTIHLVRRQDRRFEPFLSPQAETAILVELEGNASGDVTHRIGGMIDFLRHRQKLAFGSWSVTTPSERELFGELLKKSENPLGRLAGEFQVVTFMEDVEVPLPGLASFLPAVQNILKKHNLTASLGGHIGQGQLHIRPILPPETTHPIEAVLPAAEEIFEQVFRRGGTIRSATPAGLTRSIFLPRQAPELVPIYEKIKKFLDPDGIMNPGRVVPTELNDRFFPTLIPGPNPWLGLLRNRQAIFEPHESSRSETDPSEGELTVESPPPARRDPAIHQLEVQIKWEPGRLAREVNRCTGCGLCRSRTSGTRMCPIFRHFPDEPASCRAKANLLRGILDGRLPLETLTQEELRGLSEMCLNCHICETECPTEAGIPQLAFRLRSAQNAAHGLSLADKLLANSDVVLKFGSLSSGLFNRLLSGRLFRWLGERFLAIPQGRKFPKIERFSFLSRIAWSKRYRRPANTSRHKIVLFIDTFANHFDSRLAEAAVKVLEHNGIEVHIPTRQSSSGHAAFSFGHIDRAEHLAERNVRLLADYCRGGFRVVTLEPVSALCISREYSWLRDDPETKRVAEQTVDLVSFLLELHRQGELDTHFSPLETVVGYHAPCRTLALERASALLPTPAEELLRLIPGLDVRRLERGCCGLAGPQGVKKSNHSMSLRLGIPLFLALREPSIKLGATECNFCRLQMEQGTEKSVVHPVKLLAAAYGLAPEPVELPGRVKKR